MGLYWIPCKQCGEVFYWFSGNMDQRCSKCKEGDAERQKMADTTKSDDC